MSATNPGRPGRVGTAWYGLLLLGLTSCPEAPLETDDTDVEPDSDIVSYECSALESNEDRTEAIRAWIAFNCHWQVCAFPDSDELACREAQEPIEWEPDDWLGMCALEECIASVPVVTECPPDADTNVYWYLFDPACYSFVRHPG